MKTMNRQILSALGLSVSLAGCAGKDLRPTEECGNGPLWTCGKSGPCAAVGFSQGEKDLCAVGTADQVSSQSLGVQAASTRARVEMGAVLKSNLEGYTSAIQDSLAAAGGEDATQKLADLAQNVVKTQMAGIVIVRTHHNKEQNVYYALAMLDSDTLKGVVKSQVEALGAFKSLSEAKKAEVLRRADLVESKKDKAMANVQD